MIGLLILGVMGCQKIISTKLVYLGYLSHIDHCLCYVYITYRLYTDSNKDLLLKAVSVLGGFLSLSVFLAHFLWAALILPVFLKFHERESSGVDEDKMMNGVVLMPAIQEMNYQPQVILQQHQQMQPIGLQYA